MGSCCQPGHLVEGYHYTHFHFLIRMNHVGTLRPQLPVSLIIVEGVESILCWENKTSSRIISIHAHALISCLWAVCMSVILIHPRSVGISGVEALSAVLVGNTAHPLVRSCSALLGRFRDFWERLIMKAWLAFLENSKHRVCVM